MTYDGRGNPGADCPYCGKANNAATNTEDPANPALPNAGDASLCLYCGGLAVFVGDGLVVRKPSPQEKAELEADPRISAAIAVVEDIWLSE